ncbi:hypothetical protein H1C71_003556, partial [Ictidomys tridecemlineatus]
RQTQHLYLYVVLRIEPGLHACQASALPLEPHPQSREELLSCCQWYQLDLQASSPCRGHRKKYLVPTHVGLPPPNQAKSHPADIGTWRSRTDSCQREKLVS